MRELSEIEVGLTIRMIRERLNLNQTQFGDKVGADQGAVSYWEKGKGLPNARALYNIARLAGRSTDWVLTGEDWQIKEEDLIRDEEERQFVWMFRRFNSRGRGKWMEHGLWLSSEPRNVGPEPPISKSMKKTKSAKKSSTKI